MRVRTSSLRFVSCVEVAESEPGKRACRSERSAWTSSGVEPKWRGSPPTSFRDASRT